MSGASPIVVSGLRFSINGEFTDLPLCSLLHEVASHINNSDVRSNLHERLAQGSPSGRVSVTVDSYQEGGEESYTLTSESLQVTIPSAPIMQILFQTWWIVPSVSLLPIGAVISRISISTTQ